MYCYTSYPSAELFVNGKSQGRIVKNPNTRLDRYRLRWNNVKYEPGELRVVAYNYDGTVADTQTVRTAGAPAHIVLKADRPTLNPAEDDLAFVTVSLTDRDGNPCPTASNLIKASVKGAGSLRATCNGDATSLVPFTSDSMPLFNGEMVIVVGTKGKGNITLTVSAEGLPDATLTIN